VTSLRRGDRGSDGLAFCVWVPDKAFPSKCLSEGAALLADMLFFVKLIAEHRCSCCDTSALFAVAAFLLSVVVVNAVVAVLLSETFIMW
jgi:hypothetical protein